AVGERELQVAGDEASVKGLAVLAHPSADDGERLDAGQVQPLEVAEHLVLPAGQLGLDLLDGEDAAGEPDEAHDMARDTPGEGREELLRPLLERNRPGQVEQGRVRPGG